MTSLFSDHRADVPSLELLPAARARVAAECRALRLQIIQRFDRWSDLELSRGNHRSAEQLSRRAEELRAQFAEVAQ